MGRDACGHVLKRFRPYFRFVRPAMVPLLLGIGAGILYGVFSGFGMPAMVNNVFPIIFQDEEKIREIPEWFLSFVDLVFGNDINSLMLAACLLIPVVFFFRSLGGYFNSYFINKAGLIALEGIRDEVFGKLQSLPLSFYQRYKSGDLLSRVTNDTQLLRRCVVTGSADFITQPVTLIGAMWWLISNAVKNESFFVVLIALVSVPLCVLPIKYVGRRLGKGSRKVQGMLGGLTENLTESLQAPLEIRTYNMQEVRRVDFRERIKKLFREMLKLVKYQGLISPTIEVMAATGFAVALFFGARHGLTLAEFMAVGIALYISYEPVKRIGKLMGLFHQGVAAVERLEEILEEVDALPDPESPKRPDPLRATVSFRGVGFSYGDEPVLKDVSIDVTEGETIGLVGSSGAGKSTFVNLIPRLYEVSGGVVEVGGQDVREWSKHELREQIAYVPQQPALFAVSVAENIRVGRPGASDEEVKKAAELAYAHEFIEEFPQGYETLVGERGSRVSGGQRQRIALARAFLKQAPILILDEAASALDSESENRIQVALETLVKDRTTFIIAHRFSTLSLVDRILVLDRGNLVGMGTHESLLADCDVYRNLYERQVI